ncbi:amino acid ABC transporter substrate-binding protein (PAAT family) [Humitalea rosea]|uniref:Amino acid ABC transporter substrate-binding protein (PAAT family) n=1 Tax=Humitalea rosea TaxID=990373 RepID=A0A2W7IKU0_9PROT|nr:transporter substrate-binding domain-containing protein [Humitalea rosea]PZW45905.1 amino acid ABC transporter substrate-binding protein (PAAT family) [Humitalea rosea]
MSSPILARFAAPLALAAAVLLAPALARPAAAQAAAQPPLRCAVDGTFAPHAFPRLEGGVQGFNVDLFRAIARQMGREIVIDSATFSGLVPAMNAGRYDFLCAPTTVTAERAPNMLFTEGYLYTEYQFGIRRGTPPITSLEDLRGKSLSVNKGSNYDSWAKDNAERYGFTVQAYDTQPDAVQAVISGRAYANLAGNTVVRYAASRQRQFIADYVLTETRAHWSAPFPLGAEALRAQVENALECLKKDGTVARLSAQWFGDTPGPDSAENTVFPGTGVPGMPHYDPTPREPRC